MLEHDFLKFLFSTIHLSHYKVGKATELLRFGYLSVIWGFYFLLIYDFFLPKAECLINLYWKLSSSKDSKLGQLR